MSVATAEYSDERLKNIKKNPGDRQTAPKIEIVVPPFPRFTVFPSIQRRVRRQHKKISTQRGSASSTIMATTSTRKPTDRTPRKLQIFAFALPAISAPHCFPQRLFCCLHKARDCEIENIEFITNLLCKSIVFRYRNTRKESHESESTKSRKCSNCRYL